MVRRSPSRSRSVFLFTFPLSSSFRVLEIFRAPKPVTSPVPVQWYPALSALLLVGGLFFTAFFFIYEATSSTRNRSLAKEVVIAAVASTFLGFGSLFLLLATGVYV
ncbi:hypothetical protein C4D60_Mb04t37600 [Musa balbisiana]|uniref:Dolichyl-diphosphooligosaccharide-protein glycosyltransferase subunit OST5 n=1 Tax=Musa balbisiana TaxID=52838 RepID=A0A4S8KHH5_MUSBA|nr:hypothetical protein C4D60_Mb04t37600 [Musa balbisiana]